MKIAIGSDHRGFKLKEYLIKTLEDEGYEIIDKGPSSDESVDYPVYARKVGKSVSADEAGRGILICGSGIGVSIAANKIKGIRAALVRSKSDAEMSVRHDKANILCLGADTTSKKDARDMVMQFLKAEFDGGRHQRRIDIISDLEEEK